MFDIIVCSTSLREYDRRMQRIISCLEANKKKVYWISRSVGSKGDKKIISCLFKKGIFFYLEFNLKLFFKLLGLKTKAIYAVDLDTLLAASIAKQIKGKKLIFDSHEYFTEVPELLGKPLKKSIWQTIARFGTNRADICLTVNQSLAGILSKKYNKPFHVVRNVPDQMKASNQIKNNNKVLFYLGAVNKGRGVELAIQAVEQLDEYSLIIVGEGDLSLQLKKQANHSSAKDRIQFAGYIEPHKIEEYASKASIGLNMLQPESLNYKYSLANKFFDYAHFGLPSIHMHFPEYKALLNEYKVGIMSDDYSTESLIACIQQLENIELFSSCIDECNVARNVWNWDQEKEKLSLVMSVLKE